MYLVRKAALGAQKVLLLIVKDEDSTSVLQILDRGDKAKMITAGQMAHQ